jgi:magnesium-transporting ATPase (P-type)
MKLENISVVLRPRGAYEATDLGVRLVQRNAGIVFRAWLVFVGPLMLLALSLVTIKAWLPALVIWWLKPAYDRVVLYVLSRAAFGEQVGLSEMALAWRSWLGNGLLGALTWRRLEFARAFTLPMYVLEGLKGKRRRQRSKVLQKNTRSQAVLTQLAFMHIELALYFSMLMLLVMMLPVYTSLPIWSWLFSEDTPLWWSTLNCAIAALVMMLVEPMYVGAGFALYLNRRVELEAWDIELTLRRALDSGQGSSEVPAALLARGAGP